MAMLERDEAMARSGRKPKFKGYDPSRPSKPDKPAPASDRVRTSRQPHRRGVDDAHRLNERAESPIGRLWLNGKITYDQLLAAERFCTVVGAYRAVIESPRSTSGSGKGTSCWVQELNDADACRAAPEDCACLRRTQAYNDAFHSLRSTEWGFVQSRGGRAEIRLKGQRVAFIVSRVVIHREDIEPQDIVYLRAGLSTLHRLWA